MLDNDIPGTERVWDEQTLRRFLAKASKTQDTAVVDDTAFPTDKDKKRLFFLRWQVENGLISDFPGQNHYDALAEQGWFTSVVQPA